MTDCGRSRNCRDLSRVAQDILDVVKNPQIVYLLILNLTKKWLILKLSLYTI